MLGIYFQTHSFLSPGFYLQQTVTALLLRLTVEFDSQLIGRPPEGHAAGGGRAWKGGTAEENIGAERRFRHGVAQGGEALAAINALV